MSEHPYSALTLHINTIYYAFQSKFSAAYSALTLYINTIYYAFQSKFSAAYSALSLHISLQSQISANHCAMSPFMHSTCFPEEKSSSSATKFLSVLLYISNLLLVAFMHTLSVPFVALSTFVIFLSLYGTFSHYFFFYLFLFNFKATFCTFFIFIWCHVALSIQCIRICFSYFNVSCIFDFLFQFISYVRAHKGVAEHM